MALPLIVGVDGSKPSLAAAEWAATEATLTGAPLRLIFAHWLLPEGKPLPADYDHLQAEVMKMLARIAEELRTKHLGLHIDCELVAGTAINQLLSTAETGSTLVIGSRGSGGFAALLLGSTALNIVAGAEHPVVVVRAHDDPRLPRHEMVLGLEAGPGREPVIEFALAEAERRSAPLRVVHAWMPPFLWTTGPIPPGEAERAAAEDHVEQQLRDEVMPLAEKYPHVQVHFDSRMGNAAHVMVDEANHALLLVLGRRRHRPISALGPVTHAAIHYGHGPIAIVPHS
ncbi:nucleotide-binding universal stress UspA family protein [Streptacidiphilus sp. MAP12-20]|uniref:universal stress protein n=1 Tax=Streptacidiphilus sp. MAP12-20 TaxID=3156299 RepID=UPI003515C278